MNQKSLKRCRASSPALSVQWGSHRAEIQDFQVTPKKTCLKGCSSLEEWKIFWNDALTLLKKAKKKNPKTI